MRTFVSDLADCLGEWENPPPETLKLLTKALKVIRISGVVNGLPAQNGRDAVDVVLEVCAGGMDIEDAIPALEYLVDNPCNP